MANPAHLKLLTQGVVKWNEWRAANPIVRPSLGEANLSGADLRVSNLRVSNLSGADLSSANLHGADLSRADLSRANLRVTNLRGAELRDAVLGGADLSGANLSGASLSGANLSDADLHNANLSDANLSGASLRRASLSRVMLVETVLADVDLSEAKALEEVHHIGPSIVDHRTLANSGPPLPEKFLRGCGLPDEIIHAIPGLQSSPIQFYSCFISYSHRDEEFAMKLHADLQDNGVRCWFAPEDMKIGDKVRGAIHDSIRAYDKLLLVLSERSVTSKWVEEEVETALQKEHPSGPWVLFPVRLDSGVIESERGWAETVRQRHIGDFTRWQEQDAYQASFARLVRDLRAHRPSARD